MVQDYFRKTFRIRPLEETAINLPLPAYETQERGALNLEHRKTFPFIVGSLIWDGKFTGTHSFLLWQIPFAK